MMAIEEGVRQGQRVGEYIIENIQTLKKNGSTTAAVQNSRE